jgi:hypothetical protein
MTKDDIIFVTVAVICFGFIGYLMIDMPIDDIIFVSLGMIWTAYTARLWIENDELKLKVMVHEDYIEQLKTRLRNKK